ncbi:MAG: flavin reductase family protein [Actinobacteria bacterium]|nr:flavin reductase family protein [Actinomycetota bacterium]
MSILEGPLRKAHRLLAPRVAYLIGTRSPSGEPDVIPVSNATSVSTDPQQVLIAVMKRWTTHTNLQHGGGFTLSVPTSDQAEGVWRLGARYSGFVTPDNATKLVASGLKFDHAASEHGPVLVTGLGWLSCRIVARLDLGGDHALAVGQVETAAFDKQAFDSDASPQRDLNPLMQVTGNRFTTAGTSYTLPYHAPR